MVIDKLPRRICVVCTFAMITFEDGSSAWGEKVWIRFVSYLGIGDGDLRHLYNFVRMAGVNQHILLHYNS